MEAGLQPRAAAVPSMGRSSTAQGAGMSIIGTIIVGFIVGLIARAVKPGNDRMGIILTTILGIAGAFVARYGGQAMGWDGPNEAAGWIASVLGAIVLLVIVGLVRRPGRF